MKINAEIKDDILVLYLFGELGHHEAIESISCINDEVTRYMAKNILLDLTGLTFMDSSGIATVMKTYKLAQSVGGNLVVKIEIGHKRRILTAAGLGKIIDII